MEQGVVAFIVNDLRRARRWLRCQLRWCGGDIVSGNHKGVVWIGWKCRDCGRIKYYRPTDF